MCSLAASVIRESLHPGKALIRSRARCTPPQGVNSGDGLAAQLILASIKSDHQPGVVARLAIDSSPRCTYEDGLTLFPPLEIE